MQHQHYACLRVNVGHAWCGGLQQLGTTCTYAGLYALGAYGDKVRHWVWVYQWKCIQVMRKGAGLVGLPSRLHPCCWAVPAVHLYTVCGTDLSSSLPVHVHVEMARLCIQRPVVLLSSPTVTSRHLPVPGRPTVAVVRAASGTDTLMGRGRELLEGCHCGTVPPTRSAVHARLLALLSSVFPDSLAHKLLCCVREYCRRPCSAQCCT